MSGLKTLIHKEYLVHKHRVLLPAYILGALFTLIILIILLVWWHSGNSFQVQDSPETDYQIVLWTVGIICPLIIMILVLVNHSGLIFHMLNEESK